MPKTTVKKSSRSVARTRRTSAKRTAVRDVALYVPYKRAWWVIDIIKLLGSARCSGLAVEHQQQTNWCWAAVSNSVSNFYDAASTWTECSIVDAELGQSTCCTNGSSAACNQSWYLDKALTRVGRLQSWASGTLTFASVQSLINNGRPPCARQGWSGGGGHFMQEKDGHASGRSVHFERNLQDRSLCSPYLHVPPTLGCHTRVIVRPTGRHLEIVWSLGD